MRARYLGADGAPAVNPITLADTAYTVSTATLVEPTPPALAWLGDGLSMAVAWRSGTTLRGRFYGSNGMARAASDLVVASRPVAEQVGEPQVAGVAGDLAILYPRATIGGDADAGQLVLRRLSPMGTAVGTDAVVTDGVQPGPASLASDGTTLAAAWTTCATDADGDACAIRVRRYDAALTALAPSRIANSTTAGSQQEPSVALLPDGSLVVAWSDGSATAPDRDGFGIRARIVYP